MRPSVGELAGRGDVVGLAARVDDPRRRTRVAAVTALRRFPGDVSATALLRALDDDSFFVALVAVQSLAAIDPDRDPEPVVRALRRRIARDDNEFLREIAQPDQPAWSEPTATEIAELGLWRFKRVDAVAELTKALDGGELAGDRPLLARTRARALRALGRLGDAATVPLMRRGLGDPHPEVRRAALEALASIGNDEAVLALRDASRRGGLLDRIAARRALRRAKRGEPPAAS